MCIDLKIQLIYSQVGQPRGRGKIERFFRTLNQKLVSDLSLITKNTNTETNITIKQLEQMVYQFITEYNHTLHSELKTSPIKRWSEEGFLPNILDSLERLDLLLLTEAKPRKVLRDGIHFQGLRYFDLILAEYIGQKVIIRYTPSDITSIRVFFKGHFLCQPVCPELSNHTISIKEIQRARNQRRHSLKKQLKTRKSLIDAVILASYKELPTTDSNSTMSNIQDASSSQTNKIRLYNNE